jgi:hypothetical protein
MGCCGLNTNNFDVPKCVNFWDANYGVEGLGAYLQQYNGNFTGRPLVFDVVQAEECLTLLRNRSCSSQTGATKQNIYGTCMTAVQGGIGVNSAGCITSLECVGGSYCKLADDGGPGVCKPLVGAGNPCDDPNYNSDRCTYLGTQNNLHCSAFGATGTCVAGLSVASACSIDAECASGICSTQNTTCVSSQPVGAPYCTLYAK